MALILAESPRAQTNYREKLAVVHPDYSTEDTSYVGQQDQDEIDNIDRRRSDDWAGIRERAASNLQETIELQTTRGMPDRCQLKRTRTINHGQRPHLLSPIPEVASPIPDQDRSTSAISDRASASESPGSRRDQPSPVISDSASASDYVSCLSSSSTSTTEQSTIQEETEVEIGIARSQSFTRLLEPNIKSVKITRAKDKGREERVDTPMTTPNGAPILPDFQKDHIPWWEAGPAEPKVVMPKFACGPSVARNTPSPPKRKESRVNSTPSPTGEMSRPRAPTPETGVLFRGVMTARPAGPRLMRSKEKRQSIGSPGIAANLECKFQYEDENTTGSGPSRKRAKSVSEQAVGVHLPVQEPVDIPHEELLRIVGEGQGL